MTTRFLHLVVSYLCIAIRKERTFMVCAGGGAFYKESVIITSWAEKTKPHPDDPEQVFASLEEDVKPKQFVQHAISSLICK